MWAEVWVRPYKTQLGEPWGYMTEENGKNGEKKCYFKDEQKDTALYVEYMNNVLKTVLNEYR